MRQPYKENGRETFGRDKETDSPTKKTGAKPREGTRVYDRTAPPVPAPRPPTSPRYAPLVRPLLLAVVAFSTLAGCRNRGNAQPPESPQPAAPAATIELPDGGPTAGIATFSDKPDESDPLVIDFLNAGQGDCIHIACPNGNSIVVDCGSKGKDDDELEAILAAQLANAKEVRLVVTHADDDHYNKLKKSLKGVKLAAFYVGGRASYLDGKACEEWFRDRGATYPTDVFDGSELGCGDDVEIEVLAASHKAPEEDPSSVAKNNASIVLRLERSGFGILLAGDAYKDAENWMIETHGAALGSDVLKLGHHGSDSSTSEDWVKAVKPKHVVITAGMHATYYHPKCSVTANLSKTKLEDAEAHPIVCHGKAGWTKTTETRSIWNSCESGHLRLTVPAEGEPTLEPHVFAQDKAGKANGRDCPVRYEK